MRQYLMALLVGAAFCLLPACGNDSPLEDAGEKADEAVRDAGRAIEDAGD